MGNLLSSAEKSNLNEEQEHNSDPRVDWLEVIIRQGPPFQLGQLLLMQGRLVRSSNMFFH